VIFVTRSEDLNGLSTGVAYAPNSKEAEVPKGPQGQKRPADVIGNAVHIARIATGEIEETKLQQPAKRKSGLAGASARKRNLTAKERSDIAKLAAEKRWKQ